MPSPSRHHARTGWSSAAPAAAAAFSSPTPGSDLQAHLDEPVLPDVHVRLLLDREAEAGRAVVEQRAAHAERLVVDEQAALRAARREALAREAGARAEARRARRVVGVDLGHVEDELDVVAVDAVPRVRRQPALDLVHEARRAEEPDARVPPDADAHQSVEADEVVHVRVRHEHVREPQELARREPRVVAEVEEQRAPLEAEIDVDARVAERVVDQAGVEDGAHN
jgi:hypothetical protein